MSQILIKCLLYATDPYEAKYRLLIHQGEDTGLKYLNDYRACIESSNDMNKMYIDIEECNLNKKYLSYLMM